MKTFSINRDKEVLALNTHTLIQENIGYFKKFNTTRYEEAAQEVYLHVLKHYKGSPNNIEAITRYIKNLARNIYKISEVEIPIDYLDEEGNIAEPYRILQVEIGDIYDKELENEFIRLYLLYEQDFLKVSNNYLKGIESEVELEKEELKDELLEIITLVDPEEFFNKLKNFIDRIELNSKQTKETEEYPVYIQENLDNIVDYIGYPIRDKNTLKEYTIDPTTLTMGTNVDIIDWEYIGDSKAKIKKLDISSYISKIYDRIYVNKGVDTDYIRWCAGKYALIAPSGDRFFELDREEFIEYVRELLIRSLLLSGKVERLVAISEDNIYFIPKRRMKSGFIKIKIYNNKIEKLKLVDLEEDKLVV